MLLPIADSLPTIAVSYSTLKEYHEHTFHKYQRLIPLTVSSDFHLLSSLLETDRELMACCLMDVPICFSEPPRPFRLYSLEISLEVQIYPKGRIKKSLDCLHTDRRCLTHMSSICDWNSLEFVTRVRPLYTHTYLFCVVQI